MDFDHVDESLDGCGFDNNTFPTNEEGGIAEPEQSRSRFAQPKTAAEIIIMTSTPLHA